MSKFENEWTREVDRLKAEKKELREALKDLMSVSPVNDPLYKRQLEAVWQKACIAITERREDNDRI